ncbi:two-component response regulator ARR2-like [Typha latifolia]|uniref:two-component response regulator ARR2-like n=1 Tax=Typha latifolia TaxID=4733 RepID=UPI003C2C90B5
MQFSSCNYRVKTCESPFSALEILREHACDFDFLLVDVHMPEMDGFELLKIVKQQLNLPVIMMSSDGRMKLMRKSCELGASFFVKKPLDISTVKNLWQHLIPKKQYSNKRESIGSSSRGPNLEDNHIERNRSSKENCASIDKGDSKQDFSNEREMKRAACPKCSKCKCEKGIDGKKLYEDEEPYQPKRHIMWNAFLENRFIEALRILGEDAVPSRILQFMNIEGLKRKHVSSHLQKYRLRKKKESLEPSVPHVGASSGPMVNCNNFFQNPEHNPYAQLSYLSNYNQQNPPPMTQIDPFNSKATLPSMFNTNPYADINNMGPYPNDPQVNWNMMANPTQGAPISESLGVISQPMQNYTTDFQVPYYDGSFSAESTGSTNVGLQQNSCEANAPLFPSYGEQNNNAATEQDTVISTEQSVIAAGGQQSGANAVANSSKIVEEEDFGDMIEKFAYGDDPWPLILQDALDHDLDLDFLNDLDDK